MGGEWGLSFRLGRWLTYPCGNSPEFPENQGTMHGVPAQRACGLRSVAALGSQAGSSCPLASLLLGWSKPES